MKRYEVYRNIRKSAMIWGLSISFFALMMISVVGSLLVVIFSFSLSIIMGVFAYNAALYITLVRFSNSIISVNIRTAFPGLISNKQTSLLNYE